MRHAGTPRSLKRRTAYRAVSSIPPTSWVIRKWQLAQSQGLAHLITMLHVTREMVDGLVEDCEAWGESRWNG